MPSPEGTTLLMDSGANVDCKPRHLMQSAMMGSVYAKYVLGIENPRVGDIRYSKVIGKVGK